MKHPDNQAAFRILREFWALVMEDPIKLRFDEGQGVF